MDGRRKRYPRVPPIGRDKRRNVSAHSARRSTEDLSALSNEESKTVASRSKRWTDTASNPSRSQHVPGEKGLTRTECEDGGDEGQKTDEDEDEGATEKERLRIIMEAMGCGKRMETEATDRTLLTGVITSLGQRDGKLKPSNILPRSYPPTADVRFKISDVWCADFPLKMGDMLRFRLSKKDPSSPFALSVELLECAPRLSTELIQYITPALADEAWSDKHLIELVRCPAVWKCFANVKDMPDAYTEKLLLFIQKIEKQLQNMKQKLAEVFRVFIASRFCQPFSGPLHRFIADSQRVNDKIRLHHAQQFLRLLLQYVPEASSKVVGLMRPMLDQQQEASDLSMFLWSCLRQISKMSSSSVTDLYWSDMPLVPDERELLRDPEEDLVGLRRVKCGSPYSSVEEYFDTYFRLLRADSFSSLRHCLRALLTGNLDTRDMNVYTDVSVALVEISSYGLHGLRLGLRVNPVRKVMNWSYCKNLMYGNLLCISISGRFDDPIWAMVADRDVKELEQHGIIRVQLCSENNRLSDAEALFELLHWQNALMVESPTFYLANKPVLMALQQFDQSQMPFKEEIVCGKPSEVRPDYLQNVDVEAVIAKEAADLDEFQLQAMRQVFSRRVVCIQGPPGTGKTFVGVRIAKCILSFRDQLKSPILIVTYKNHALDELLMKLLDDYEGKIARIGGQSREEKLQQCNWNTLCKAEKPEYIYKPLIDINNQIREMKDTMHTRALDLFKAGYLTLSTLMTYLTEKQIKSLLNKCNSLGNKDVDSVFAELHSKQSNLNDSYAKNILRLAFQQWYSKRIPATSNSSKTPQQQHELKIKRSGKTGEIVYDEEDIDRILTERMVESSSRHHSSDINVVKTDVDLADVKLASTSQQYLSQLPFLLLMNTEDLYAVHPSNRDALVQCLLAMQVVDAKGKFDASLKAYQELIRDKEDLLDIHRANILSSMYIIGMTITGANMYRSILSIVKPPVILIEEAAEVAEPRLMPLLGEWVQHLILIGDHKQLRPQVENYQLATDFHLDISMMERLTETGVGCTALGRQSRMHPDISRYLSDIYPELRDNTSVVNERREINCVSQRVFFWHHEDKEKVDRSYTNAKEADRALNLALFFIQQGNSPQQITILAPYQGQVHLLRTKFREAQDKHREVFKMCGAKSPQDGINNVQGTRVEIQTIDQYQGDENDFVIVSLTRSNDFKSCGFLNVLNRRCVSQSRGRCGLFYIGNIKTIEESKHWKTFLKELGRSGLISEKIPLKCPHHPTSIKHASTAEDIPLKESFCRESCMRQLPCNKHFCSNYCQPPHEHNTCSHRCEHVCDQGRHPCKSECLPEHDHTCKEMVEFIHRDCGHRGRKQCYQNPELVLCQEVTHFRFASCEHVGKKLCWQKVENMKCKHPCEKLLKCNHPCNMLCFEPCNHNSCQTCEAIQAEEEEQQQRKAERLRQECINAATEQLKLMEKDKDVALSTKLLPDDPDFKDEYRTVETLLKSALPDEAKGEIVIRAIYKLQSVMAYKRWVKALSDAHQSHHIAKKILECDVNHPLSEKALEHSLKTKDGPNGNGVYLSSTVSTPKLFAGISEVRYCLVVDALVGKVKRLKHGSRAELIYYTSALHDMKYDSLEITAVPLPSGLTTDVCVLPASAQVLPLYKVDYQVMVLDQLAELEAAALRKGEDKITKHELHPIRELAGNDPLAVQFKTAEATFLRLLTSIRNKNEFKKETTKYKVVKVDYWINPEHLRRFLQNMEKLVQEHGEECGKYILAFHGTNNDTESIFKNNFDLKKLSTGSGDKGWYGAGIYFSEFPQTALFYGEKLLLCRVLPGKTFDMEVNEFRLAGKLEPGYHSHRVHIQEEGHGEELVIFDRDQILPLYEIHYETI